MITSGSEKSETKSRLTAHDKRCLAVQSQLEENLASAALLLTSIPVTRLDGLVLAIRTTSISDSVMNVAKNNDRFLAILERVMAYSVWGALIGEGVILTGAFASNHGINLGAPFGIKPKEQKPAQADPEFSEDQRAMLFAALQDRANQMKVLANESTES